MAFRLPAQAPPRRHTSYSNSQYPPTLDIPSTDDPDPTAQWVLFSPSQPSITARTHTTSTERTPRTAGASRLSDFGSFGTPTRSTLALEGDEDNDEVLDEPLDEDGTELDSLDDGLHAFRAPSVTNDESTQWGQGAQAVLPAHDGLGSFQASSQTVQDQLWQHEQYNPRRRPELRLRRHSSVQRELDTIADNQHVNTERDRWQRIEKWRMDQSRVLLQEIEKETRRRRNSQASRSTDQVPSQSIVPDSLDDIPETLKEHTPVPPAAEPEADDESLWRRITRKVIQDLIGIDDSLLSVIFGESLPEEEEELREQSTTAGTDSALSIDDSINRELESVPDDKDLWQSKLLRRIAHELGVLVHQLCEHPGAFTTYLNLSSDINNEYAGMPVRPRPEGNDSQTRSGLTALSTSADMTNDATSSILSPQFTPTLRDPNKEHAAQWGIEEEDNLTRMARSNTPDPLSESAHLHNEKEYWERELDVTMVFRYLRNRFTRRNSNTDTNYTASRRHSQDASRRAAIIRQHHPLVARAQSRSQAQVRRQSQYSGGVAGPVRVSSPLLRQNFRRPSSSCASQSAKLSTISSHRTLTGSSRNYWDIGGSVESGSPIAPVGAGLGAWGDV
ncbi:hypothetical protein ASPWEDRAFT_678682 [Aspergillus wentii DTO 134E9]|uniref:Uncharacterized protein n=1 Tax=Aspergillus wentii DTO 134E9 TaxID=1073089 RepID=A0A1L9R820_ASPWE|nr:uncharacterized protein ASPWEDRAFT_678682 [Aspergillus wentii DTO 134E9]KAI9924913.1 hypothetical protein MW887_006316 [Aspergillus wentii]OJJ31075.1 hypothetical protein ASPWEDRAFT_678682 [Aspergillus wentii DTO 134E9]